MPLGIQGLWSLGAIPSSPLEQISAPSALFCLWRSQPGAFVPSGKAVLCMSPIGHQAPRGSGKDAHSQPCSRKQAPSAAAQGPSFPPLLCPEPVLLGKALPKVTADSQGRVQALLWPLQEGMGKVWDWEAFLLSCTTHSPEGPTSSTKPLGGSSRGRRRCGAAMGLPDWELLCGIALFSA